MLATLQAVQTVLRTLKHILSRLLFPTYCCGCHSFGPFLCHECYELIEFLPAPLTIQQQLSACVLDSLTAATAHTFPITKLIHSLKYNSVKDIGTYCGQLLYYSAKFPTTDFITSVPLHAHRSAERGFNQAEVIGRELARLTELPYVPLLVRARSTVSQVSVEDRDRRLTNLVGAFCLDDSTANFSLVGKSILLIDDVTTTGTTLNECAKVLKADGAAQVHGLVVAHGG